MPGRPTSLSLLHRTENLACRGMRWGIRCCASSLAFHPEDNARTGGPLASYATSGLKVALAGDMTWYSGDSSRGSNEGLATRSSRSSARSCICHGCRTAAELWVCSSKPSLAASSWSRRIRHSVACCL
eukprot:scaffold1070_cov245-Pinguiococcus_pyrenoidosus.AAC.42